MNIDVVEGDRVLNYIVDSSGNSTPNFLSVEIFEIIRAIHHHGLNTAKLLPTELESSSLAS